MSSSTKKYKVDPSWINSLYGSGNVYGNTTYGNTTYGNTTYGNTTWQNTVSATQYTAYTNPKDPHVQFIEALIQHVKTLIQDVQYAEEQKRMKENPYNSYYSSGTTANPSLVYNTTTSYPFAEDSPEVRQFRSRIKSLLEWYISTVKTELEYEHFKELEELLELPTPKTQKD